MNRAASPVGLNPKSAKLVTSIPVSGTLYAIALDGRRATLLGSGSDGALHTVDLKAAKPTVTRRWELHDNYVTGLILRGDLLVSCGYDRRVKWTERNNGKVVRSVEAHAGWVRKMAMTPDGTRLVTIGDDMLVKVWDATDGKAVASLEGHDAKTPEGYLSMLYALALSPDGKLAATGDRAGFVRVWDLMTFREIASFRARELYTFDAMKRARAIGGVRGLAFSADGSRLAVSGIGPVTNVDGFVGPCRVELWEWKTGKQLAVGQDRYNAILNQVEFTADGKWLVAVGGGDSGGAIVFWDGSATRPHIVKPKGHLHGFVLTQEGRLLAAGHDGFQIWQIG